MPTKYIYYLAFNSIPGFGRVTIIHLLESYGDLEIAWHAPANDWLAKGFSPHAVKLFQEWKPRIKLERFKSAFMRKHRFIPYDDGRYPLLLKQSPDPPAFLFTEGDISVLSTPMVAVVGTRAPSRYGTTVTEELVTALSKHSITTVSGLAIGIDSTAHRTAIAKQGKTIAVLGSGLCRIYPRANEQLTKEIIKSGGLIISEYVPFAHPTDYTFPERNRIIAGLSLATIVVEAGLKSGTFITANLALEANREVLAVPGSILSPQSMGTNRLLSQGAVVCSSIDDVISILYSSPLFDKTFHNAVA
ncbi:MAG: DNA-processing protein DprA [bacterium]